MELSFAQSDDRRVVEYALNGLQLSLPIDTTKTNSSIIIYSSVIYNLFVLISLIHLYYQSRTAVFSYERHITKNQ